MDFVKAIKQLPAKQRWKGILASGLIVWAGVLTVDMYYLKQREDFQQRFGVQKPPDAEEDVPEWKRARREAAAAAAAAAAAER